jgi:hypothetical protein
VTTDRLATGVRDMDFRFETEDELNAAKERLTPDARLRVDGVIHDRGVPV